jgi:hypothetical protein
LLGKRSIAPNVAVVFIHAVNPYGMSFWRRWNENNVDLNRNFLSGKTTAIFLPISYFIPSYEPISPFSSLTLFAESEEAVRSKKNAAYDSLMQFFPSELFSTAYPTLQFLQGNYTTDAKYKMLFR